MITTKSNYFLIVVVLIGLLAMTGVASATITEYAYGTATANQTAGGTATSAFDNNVANYWQANAGANLTMDYGAGVNHTINQIGVYGSPTWYYHFGREFRLEASNDNTNWTVLTNVTADNQPSQRVNITAGSGRYYYFNFTNPTSYRYYKYIGMYTEAAGWLNSGTASGLLAVELELNYDDNANRNLPDWHIAPSLNKSYTNATWANYNESMAVFRNTPQSFIDDTVNSTGAITNWYWDFNGDAVIDSIDQNPTYTYTSFGNYTASLTTTVNSANVTNSKVVTVVDTFDNPTYPFMTKIVPSAPRLSGGTYVGAINKNIGDYWQGYQGDYYELDYGTPRVTNTMRLQYGYAASGWYEYSSLAFNITASNDRSNWTVVYNEYNNKTSKIAPRMVANETRNYNFTNTVPYRYYRLNNIFTYQSVVNSDINGFLIAEMDYPYRNVIEAPLVSQFNIEGWIPTTSDMMSATANATLINGRTYVFNSTSTSNVTIDSYAWDMTNDGSDESASSSYSFTPTTNGVFTVKHTVSDSVHGSVSKTMNYTVTDRNIEWLYGGLGSDINLGGTASTTTWGDLGNLFDGTYTGETESNGWGISNSPINQWIQMDYGPNRSFVVNELRMRTAANYPWSAPRMYQVQGSNDGSSWTLLLDTTNAYNRLIPRQNNIAGLLNNTYIESFNNTQSYRYYRMFVNQTIQQVNMGSNLVLTEVEFIYHDPSKWLQADAYVTGAGYLGIDTNQGYSYPNQTFTVLKDKSITFKDISVGNPNSWLWDVNGDGIAEGFTKDYSYSYTTPGVYNATLTVGDGTRTSVKNLTIYANSSFEYWYWWNLNSGTASASAITWGNANYPFCEMNAETESSAWGLNSAYPNAWIQMFYGKNETHVINQVSLRQGTSYSTSMPRQFSIAASNDGSNWTVLDNRLTTGNRMLRRQAATTADAWFTYNFTNTNSYKYYRMYVNKSTPTASTFQYMTSSIEWKYQDPTDLIDTSFYIEDDGVNGQLTQEILLSQLYPTFDLEGMSAMTGRQIQFKDTTLGSPSSWSWNFGDGNTSSSQNPTKTYATRGVYNVTLTATKGAVSMPKTVRLYVTDSIEWAYYLSMANSTASPTWGMTASTTTWGSPIYLFDNSFGTSMTQGWGTQISGTAAYPSHWIQADYGKVNTSSKRVINELTLQGVSTEWYNNPRSFRFEGSNDASNWTLLENRTENYHGLSEKYSAVAPGTNRTYFINNTNEYRYYRLFIISTGSDVALSELFLKYRNPSTLIQSDFYVDGSIISYEDAINASMTRSVYKDDQVRFVDRSIGTGLSYAWDFNGDGAVDSTNASVNYTYATPGTYNATHTVSAGSLNSTKFMFINVSAVQEPAYGIYVGTPENYHSLPNFSPAIYSNWYQYQISDHNIASYVGWNVNPAVTNTWIIQDYGGAKTNASSIPGWSNHYPAINQYRLQTSATADDAQYMPVSWVLRASNNLTTWTTLDTQTSVPNWTTSETRWYNFTNNETYRFYNFSPKALKPGITAYDRVPELQYFTSGTVSSDTPVASYTQSSVASPSYGAKVQFNDTSTNNPISWNWSFGDGTYSTAQNPVHWYSVAGTYSINMTATNVGGSSTTSPDTSFDLQSDWDTQVKSWMSFNNTATEDKNVNNTWVARGDAAVTGTGVKAGFGAASLILDGTGDYVDTGASGFDMAASNVTIECWFKRGDSSSGIETLVSKGNLSTNGYSLFLASNKLSFVANQEAPSSQLTLSSSATTTDSNWHHAAVERRGNTWNLYLDGVSVATSAWSGTVTSNAFNLTLGQSSYATPYSFNGSIDEFRYSTYTRWDDSTSFTPPQTEYKSSSQVEMNFPPVASFSVNSQAIKADVLLNITDTSANAPTTWEYSWDDGTANGTTPNPSHAYSAGDMLPPTKNYTINQYVSNPAGSSVSSQTVTVYEFDATHTEIDFMADYTTNVYTGHPVNFTEWNNQSATGWYWQFGDGQTSTTQNPSHSYANPGNWTVNLTLTSPVYGATKFLSKTDYITTLTENPSPVANFTATPRVGVNGTLIYFTDTSSNTPTSWAWDFNNDGTNETTVHNPSYTYPAIGNYTVKMYATNVFGSNVSVKANYIELGDAPFVNFTGAPLDGGVPLLVEFTDTSFNGTSYSWDLDGDGDIDSTSRDTNITYAVGGYYNVSHTATNYYGSNTTNKTNYIHAGGSPVANFTQQKTGMTTAFNDTSTGDPTSWYWDFDDGNSSALQNPTHTFPTAGTYDVNLTATNIYGSGSTVKAAAATNASGFNRQDIIMDQQYTLTLTFKDSSGSHNLIPIVNVTDSNGDSIMTSVAVAELHYSYGPIVITAMADGYYGTVVSYVITRDRAETVYLTSTSSNSDSSTSSWAATHNVKFNVKTLFGAPIEDVLVTAEYVETSGPLEWLTDWAGVPSNVSVQNTTLSGSTGSDGAVDFLMVESVKYEVVAVKAGVVDKTMTIYPKDDYYTIWADVANASSRFETGYNELEMLSVAVNGTELNATHGRIHVVYTDLLDQTNSATVYVNRTVVSGNSSTESTVASYTSSAAGNFTHDFDLAGTRDQSYTVRVRSTGDTFTDVERDYGVTFKPGPRSLGIPEPLLVYVGMVLLIFIALMFTRSLPGPATIVIMFFAWIFYFMGWWTNLASDFVVVTALIVYSAIAVLFNVMIRSKKRNFE